MPNPVGRAWDFLEEPERSAMKKKMQGFSPFQWQQAGTPEGEHMLGTAMRGHSRAGITAIAAMGEDYRNITGRGREFYVEGLKGQQGFSKEFAIPSRVNIPGFDFHTGIVQQGATLTSYPGHVLRRSGGGYKMTHIADVLMEMGQRGNMQGMSNAATGFYNTSRSAVATTLGPDWTLAFARSHQINIGEFQVTLPARIGDAMAGTRSVTGHLEEVARLQAEALKSGGFGLGKKQAAFQDYYNALIGELEGANIPFLDRERQIFPSDVKDAMFREHALVSTRSPQMVGFGLGMKQISKGIHQYSKLTPIEMDKLNRSVVAGGDRPFRTSVATGSMAFREAEFVQSVAAWSGMNPNVQTRLSATAGYVIGPQGERMGDSYWYGGRRMHRLLGSIESQQGFTTAHIHTTGLGSKQLGVHEGLRPYVEAIRRGQRPAGMRRAASGEYIFDKALRLGQHKPLGYNAAGELVGLGLGTRMLSQGPRGYSGVYLGTSVGEAGLPTQQGDIFRSLVSAKGTRGVHVHGISLHKDKISLRYSDVTRPGAIREQPILLGGTRGTMRTSMQQIMAAGPGGPIDMLAAGRDVGLEMAPGGKGFTVSREFISRRVVPHFADVARERGKLGKFTAFAGLGLERGGGAFDPATFFKEGQIPEGQWLDDFLAKLTGASPAALQAAGLQGSEELIRKTAGGGYEIPISAARMVESGPGAGSMILPLRGQEFSPRAGMPQARIGRGAMKIRLTDTMMHINQQAGGATGALRKAYQGLQSHFMEGIKTGVSGVFTHGPHGQYIDLGRGVTSQHIGRQVAGILLAPSLGTQATGGLLKGLAPGGMESGGRGRATTLADWYTRAKAGRQRPIAPTLAGAQKIMRGPVMGKTLAGTIHGLESPQGFMLELPQPIQSLQTQGINPKHITQRGLYVPADMVLGVGPSWEGVHFGGAGGLGSLGLGRKKGEMMSLLYQEMAAHEAGGGQLSAYSPSEQLTGRMSAFATQTRQIMVNKGGMLSSYLNYQPKGAMSGIASDATAAGIRDRFTVGIHELDFIDVAMKGGYSKREAEMMAAAHISGVDVGKAGPKGGIKPYVMTTRDPLHAAHNVQFHRLQALPGSRAARGRIYMAPGAIALEYGDFDHDAINFILEKSQQGNMEAIFRGERALIKEYHQLTDDALAQSVAASRSYVTGGGFAMGGEATTMAQLKNAVASRAKGAGGGGALVGAVDPFYRRMSALGQSFTNPQGSKFLAGLSEMSADLGTSARLMANDAVFNRYLGTLQETGVYGMLKKGAAGFGSEEVGVIEAMAQYGAAQARGQSNAGELRRALRSSIYTGIKSQFTEGMMLAPHDVKALGLTGADLASGTLPDTAANRITDILMGDTSGHGGIGTLAAIRSRLNQVDPQTPGGGLVMQPIEELFRGGSPAGSDPHNRSLSTIFSELIGQEPKAVAPGMQATYAMGGQDRGAIGAQRPRRGAAGHQFSRRPGVASSSNLDSVAGANIGAKSTPGTHTLAKNVQRFSEAMSSPWGKSIAIGAGVIAGIGAVDAMFGADEPEEYTPPIFMGSTPFGAPLPPEVQSGYPGEWGPSAGAIGNRHANIGRIERPMAQRQMYNMSATTHNNVDFGSAMSGYSGSAIVRPTQSTYSVDKPGSGMDSRETAYQIRRRLESSF